MGEQVKSLDAAVEEGKSQHENTEEEKKALQDQTSSSMDEKDAAMVSLDSAQKEAAVAAE